MVRKTGLLGACVAGALACALVLPGQCLGAEQQTGSGQAAATVTPTPAPAAETPASPDPQPSHAAKDCSWRKDADGWRLVAADGTALTGWQAKDGIWYWLGEEGGDGLMRTGWVSVDGASYYLRSSGAMATGWLSQGGSWYYLERSGARASGWKAVDGVWYWLDPASGVMATGWREIDGVWYSFNPSGAMRTGWHWDGRAWYYLRSSGAMATGWVLLDGVWYWLDPASGAMATRTTVIDGVPQRFSASGAWLGRASARDAVAAHGRLQVSGTRVVDAQGRPFQLRGVSTHGLAWFPQFVNAQAFASWADWGANCVRLALYTDEYGGWCNGGDHNELLSVIDRGVNAATSEGMYVIIDWHVLNDRWPSAHQGEAIDFFRTVCARYAGYENVLYEICNEPNSGPSWGDVRAYAEQVIPVIRSYDPQALVIVGTPTWSQDVDQAASWPLGFGNVLYALHFYAGTHGSWLRDRAQAAVNAGLPILISEFGACDASGNGWVNQAEASAWLSWATDNGIGAICWNLSNKAESSSLIASWCDKTGGWSVSDLSEQGQWYQRTLESLPAQ